MDSRGVYVSDSLKPLQKCVGLFLLKILFVINYKKVDNFYRIAEQISNCLVEDVGCLKCYMRNFWKKKPNCP